MSARHHVLGLAAVGLGLLAIGALVFFSNFPHGPGAWLGYTGDYTDELPGDGNLRVALGGAAIAGVGFLVILVPIIAWGVRLGRMLERD